MFAIEGGGGGGKTIFCLPHFSKGSTNAPLARLLSLWFSEYCFVDDSFCLCSFGHCLSYVQVLPTNPTYFPCDNHLILTEISEHNKTTTCDVRITTSGSRQTLQLLARDRHYNFWLGTDITTPCSGQTLQLLARDRHYNSLLGTDITTPGSGQTLQLLARDRHYNSLLGTDITTPGSGQTLQLLARDRHYNSWLGTDITTPGSGQTLQLLARDRHYNSLLGTDITTPCSGQTQSCYSYLKYTLRTLP